VLGLGDSNQGRIEVETIDLESMPGGEEMSVFARAAGDVEDAPTPRPDALEKSGNLGGLSGVVLDAGVDQVVDLC